MARGRHLDGTRGRALVRASGVAGAVALALISLTGRAAAAVPAVDALEMYLVGTPSAGDLELRWPPVSTAVDGYRVYEHDEELCSAPRLLCETAGTSCLLAGVLGGPSPKLWRVAAYAGIEEGPRSPAAWFCSSPAQWANGVSNWNLLSVPQRSTWVRDLDMCQHLHWDAGPSLRFHLINFDPALGLPRFSFCEWLSSFALVPGRAYVVRPLEAGHTAEIFGSEHPYSAIALDTPRGSSDIGLHPVSLPYDHGYSDLASLAEDVPGALDVLVFDPATDRRLGLSRAAVGAPWSGDNVDLLPLRGQGVFLTVAAATSWTPRRVCDAPGQLAPRRVAGLLAARAGDDVLLEWQADPLAGGGYDVVRIGDRNSIPASLGEPVHLSTPGPAPSFPVTDAAAVRAPEPLLFYQTIARSADGVRGGL